jgi:8-oxo-dGTP diphosphatase
VANTVRKVTPRSGNAWFPRVCWRWAAKPDGVRAAASRVARVQVTQAVLRLADVTASQALGAPRDAHPAADTTTDRYRPVVDVYVLLRRPDGTILLLERSGTGYADGQLCPPSGHLEEGESVARCAVREAAEETGVGIDPADLVFTHVVHHRNPRRPGPHRDLLHRDALGGRAGQPGTHKCAGLQWADPARPCPFTGCRELLSADGREWR